MHQHTSVAAGRQAKPYAAVPHAILHDTCLTANDKVLAGHLLGFARNKADCWPSNGRLAADMGVSVRTVQYGLRRLEAAGWIRCEDSDANRTGRLITLCWRVAPPLQAVAPPPVQPVAHPPAKQVAREEDRIVKETKTEGAGPRPTTRPDPVQALFEETPRVLRKAAQTPLPSPPAPAPQGPPRPAKRPLGLTLTELAALSDDPILARELARRTAPRPEAPPPPASTEEMALRLREDPTYVPKLAELLAQEFDDRGSWSGLHRAVGRAWSGEIEPADVADSYRKAMGPHVRNRGAIFMVEIERHLAQRGRERLS